MAEDEYSVDMPIGASPGIVEDSIDAIQKKTSMGLEQPISTIDANVAKLVDAVIKGYTNEGGSVSDNGLTGGSISTFSMGEDSANSLLSGIEDIVRSVALEAQRQQAERDKEANSSRSNQTRQTKQQTDILSERFSKEDIDAVEQHKLDQQNIERLEKFQQQLDDIANVEQQRKVLEEQGFKDVAKMSDATVKRNYNQYEQQQTQQSTVGQTAAKQTQASANSATSAIKNLESGNISGTVGNIGNILGSFDEEGGTGTGLAGVLGSLGGSGAASALGSIGSAISGFAAPIAAVLGIAGAYGEAQNLAGSLNATALNQGSSDSTIGIGMAAQSALTGYTTGLTTQQAENIQSELSNNYSKYGTDQYNQGYNWSVNSYSEYGVDPTVAAKLYTSMVVEGTSTMADLNTTMDSFKETTENTDLSLQQVEADFESVSKTLTSATGGNSVVGTEEAADLSTYNTEGTGESSTMESGMVSLFSGDDQAYQSAIGSYRGEGKSYAVASFLSALDMLSNKTSSAASKVQYLAMYPLVSSSDKTFFQWFQEAENNNDWSGFQDALEKVYDNQGGGRVNRTTLISDLKTLDVPDTYSASADKLIEYLQGVGSSASDMESGNVANSDQITSEQEAGETFGNEGWESEIQKKIKTQDIGAGIGTTESAYDTLNSIISSDSGFSATDNNDKDEMLGVLNEEGLLSNDQFSNLTDTSSKEMTDELYQAYSSYQSSNDNAENFTDWLSDTGKDTASDIIDKYDNVSSSSSSSQKVNVNVSLSWRDGSDKYIASKVDSVTQQEQADSGSD